MYLRKQKDNSKANAGVLIANDAAKIESAAQKWISTHNEANLTSTPVAYERFFTDRLFMKEFK